MFRQMLYVDWKATRLALLPFVVAAFALPLLSVQGGVVPGDVPGRYRASMILSQLGLWLPLYPLLATVTGVVVALAVWNPDHQAGHAYALSLPIPRWRYVLLKMADGAIFLLPAALVFWFGALLAAGSVTLPDGLHAYPTLLAMRFWMAMLLAYAVLFALAAGSVRTILIVVGGVFGGLLVGEVVVRFLDAFVLALEGWSFIRAVLDVLSGWPGPFRVYAGNWMLIDV